MRRWKRSDAAVDRGSSTWEVPTPRSVPADGIPSEGGSRKSTELSHRTWSLRSPASLLLGLALLFALPGCGKAKQASGPTMKSPPAGQTAAPAAGQTAAPTARQEAEPKSLDVDIASVDKEIGALDQDLSGADQGLNQTEESDPGE